MDACCGVRGEYRFGAKKAMALVEQEDNFPRFGALLYASLYMGGCLGCIDCMHDQRRGRNTSMDENRSAILVCGQVPMIF